MIADIIVLLFLIWLNGFFSLSEMAVVSSSRQRLQALVTKRAGEQGGAGVAGVETAISLHEDPNRFLSAVQVGITLIGVFAGAFGGATLAEPISAYLADLPMIGSYATPVAFGLIVLIITYLSLILGELVPKRIALSNPEAIAGIIARPMVAFSRALSPVVTLLSWSTDGVLKLYGIAGQQVPDVTEDEIKHLIAAGAESGAIEDVERDIVNRVFLLGDMRVSEIMTPRVNMVWLDLDAPYDDNVAMIRRHQNLRYAVRRGESGPPIGMVRLEDLVFDREDGTSDALFRNMAPPLFVPRTSSVLKALSILQSENKFMAIVIDEYGEVEGTISFGEIFFAIVGDLSGHALVDNKAIVQREDGSYLIDGVVSLGEVKELLKLKKLPGEDSSEVNTLAGVMFNWFQRLPTEGEYFGWNGYRFEIADIDGPRIDKILVVPAQNLPIGGMMGRAVGE